MASKYEPLERHLRGLDRATDHTLSFAAIESILGGDLPKSARIHPAWWANQRGPGHSQTHSWMNAGWHSGGLDLKSRQVTFRPVALPREPKLGSPPTATVRPLTIEQAKAGIALKLGIDAAAIDIVIRA